MEGIDNMSVASREGRVEQDTTHIQQFAKTFADAPEAHERVFGRHLSEEELVEYFAEPNGPEYLKQLVRALIEGNNYTQT